MGGGGLYGTVGDYLKFAQVFLHDGTFNGAQILKPETVRLMSQNAAGDVRVRPLKTAQPPISNDVDFIDGMQWGLSFLINPEPLPTGRSAGSLAWAGLANSYYWIDPDEGRGGRLRDANPAVLRREVRSRVPGVRDRGLQGDLNASRPAGALSPAARVPSHRIHRSAGSRRRWRAGWTSRTWRRSRRCPRRRRPRSRGSSSAS